MTDSILIPDNRVAATKVSGSQDKTLHVLIERKTLDTNFAFTAGTVSNVIDKRLYAAMELGPIPLALNGRTITILSGATDATSPERKDSAGNYTALLTLAAVTGKRFIAEAEIMAIHDISISISGENVTTSVPVQFTA